MSNSNNIKDLQFNSINELLEDYKNGKNTIAIFEEIVLRAKRFEYYMENRCHNIEFTLRDHDKRINSIEKEEISKRIKRFDELKEKYDKVLVLLKLIRNNHISGVNTSEKLWNEVGNVISCYSETFGESAKICAEENKEVLDRLSKK